MKIRLFTLFLAGMIIILAICCSSKKSELHLFTWADYYNPELIKKFEKENSCKVVIDTFDSNETMYAKIKAGAEGYDLINPSSYMAKIMFKEKLIKKIEHSKIPNIVNLDEQYLKISPDPDLEFSIHYMLSITVVGYLKDKVNNPAFSWNIFSSENFRGRMTLLNDMREVVGAALKYLGYSLNTTDPLELEKARDIVILWKKNIAKFENEQYKPGIASGEFFIVQGYSGDLIQVMSENPQIAIFIPEEGSSLSTDEFVIPVKARNEELAYKFINFFLDAENCRRNIEFVKYLAPNKAAYQLFDLKTKELFQPFLSGEIWRKCEMLEDLGENNILYTKIWDEIKAAR